MSTIEQLSGRVVTLEHARTLCDIELVVIRGSVPLAHKQPVDDGALGEVVLAIQNVKRLATWVVSTLVVATLGGAGGFYVAFKDSLVEQGRVAERDVVKAEYLQQVEVRLRELEGHYFAWGTPTMVVPKVQ